MLRAALVGFGLSCLPTIWWWDMRQRALCCGCLTTGHAPSMRTPLLCELAPVLAGAAPAGEGARA
jgi:hypothetical protein